MQGVIFREVAYNLPGRGCRWQPKPARSWRYNKIESTPLNKVSFAVLSAGCRLASKTGRKVRTAKGNTPANDRLRVNRGNTMKCGRDSATENNCPHQFRTELMKVRLKM